MVRKEKYGFKIYGYSSGDNSVGIPSLSFELDIDSHNQGLTKDWIETINSGYAGEDKQFKTYREYLRAKIRELIMELHDNGNVFVEFEDEENYMR